MKEKKFRAWDGKQMINMPIATSYGLERFFGYLNIGIENFTLMQYIGIKDHNSNEIYDKDILYVAGLGKLLVYWNEEGLMWRFKSIKKDDEGDYDYQDIIEDLENIAGNEFQTPELMEVES